AHNNTPLPQIESAPLPSSARAPVPSHSPPRFLSSARLSPAPRAPKPTTMAGGSHAPAPPNHRKRKVPAGAAEDEADAEAQELRREVEELEEGLSDLDRRVLEHLRGTATRLTDSIVTRLAALRPPATLEFPTVSTSSAEEDQEQIEKLNILKSKIEANIADLPKSLPNSEEATCKWNKLHMYWVRLVIFYIENELLLE
ncbi:unnamed protein product, partial [Urochloa humidicola]